MVIIPGSNSNDSVPAGIHTAYVEGFFTDVDCNGVEYLESILFYLRDIDEHFCYSCNVRDEQTSTHRCIFSMFCSALGVNSFNKNILKNQEFKITIVKEPLSDQQMRFDTIITDIKLATH